jgi:cobalt/nickel transport system permease protein
MSVSAVYDLRGLAAGSVLPLAALCACWRGGAAYLRRAMLNVNRMLVLIWIFLPLAYAGDRAWGIVSIDGLRAALVITWKLNIVSAVMISMVASMGIPALGGALGRLGFPLRLRMLLLLMARYTLLLSGRMATLCRAIHLRSPGISGALSCRAHASMVGTTLIHSSDRAERASLAMSLRGGEGGFSRVPSGRWKGKDSLACSVFLANAVFVIAVSRFWG